MKKIEHCSSCGAKLVVYSHNLNSGLALGLSKLNKAGGASPLRSLGLTVNQFNNFQKLQYWLLVTKSGDDSGVWIITKLGQAFLRGKPIPKTAMTFRNQIKGHSESMTTIDILRDEYKKKRNYVETRRSHEA